MREYKIGDIVRLRPGCAGWGFTEAEGKIIALGDGVARVNFPTHGRDYWFGVDQLEYRDLDTNIEKSIVVTAAVAVELARSPLPHYAGCEELEGRLRAYVPMELFRLCADRGGHDLGDEDTSR